MYIWNKVLLGLITVLSLVFIFFAAQTLGTHKYWREIANKQKQQLEELEKANRQLEGRALSVSDEAQRSVAQLRLELHKQMIGRGRVWYQCEKRQVDPKTGSMVVVTSLPDPSQISKKMVLYVFDENAIQQGGRYLGRFTVKEVVEAQKQLVLVPTVKLTPQDIKQVVESRGPLTLYEVMPPDYRGLFAEVDEATLREMFSPESVEPYIKNGKPAQPDDPENVVIDDVVVQKYRDAQGNYLRPLKDYEVLFREQHRQYSRLVDLIEAAKRDKQYVETALADARRQAEFRQKQIALVKAEKEKLLRQRDLVAEHQEAVKTKLDAIEATIQQLLKENRALAGEIARLQVQASREIDARTRRLTLNGNGR